MFIENYPQKVIRILTEGISSSQLNKFGEKLVLGQILRLKILDIMSGGKVVADFQGQKVTFQTADGLIKGQNISVKVDQLSPSINLRIIDSIAERKTPLSHITPDAKVQVSQVKGENLQNLISNLLGSDLKQGQVLRGKVYQVLDSKTLQVDFQGKQFPVQITGDAASFLPGQSIAAKVQNNSGRLSLIAQNQNIGSLRVDAAMIKPYLVAKQDLGLMAANLWKTVFDNPLLKDLKIDSGLIERLRETIRVILPNDGKPPDDSGVKEQVDRSGINYETKVKKVLSRKLIPEGRSRLARDLKGQLIELQDKLEKKHLLQQKGQQISYSAGKEKAIQELVYQIKLASDNIEFQQLSNQFAKQNNNPILIQIPDPFSPETKTAKLYILNDGESHGKNKKKKSDYSLVFLLNITTLGNLRVDAKTNGDEVLANIKVGKKPIADFIASQAPGLVSRLKEMGFQAVVTTSVQDVVEMEVDDPLNQLLIDEPTSLVDITT